METIRVKDVMAKKLVTLRPDTDIYQAISILLKNRISGAPVVSSEGRFVGVFSEVNCMSVMVTGSYHNLPNSRVSTFMDKAPKTISEETDLLTAAQIFLKSHVRRLPVLRGDRVVGQVSRRDLLRAIWEKGVEIRVVKNRTTKKSRPPKPLYLSAMEDRDFN